MRDILDDLFGNQPIDPTESARRGLRTQLRKRFYQRATVGEGAPCPVLVDGRAVPVTLEQAQCTLEVVPALTGCWLKAAIAVSR